MRFLAFLLLMGCACGEAPAEPDDCSRSFDPSPELREATIVAAERWSAATGCPITVAPGGSPVEWAPVVVNVKGKRVAGLTRRENGVPVRVLVSGESPNPARTVAHELGHMLGADGHAPHGLLRDEMGDAALDVAIDADALALVCASLPCRMMLPE